MNRYEQIKEHLDEPALMQFFYISLEYLRRTPWELADELTEEQLLWLFAYCEKKYEIENAALAKARNRHPG